MRSYLKSPGHTYVLDSDVVSIGKGIDTMLQPPEKFKNARAHIPISSGKADPYHAILEKQPNKMGFFLTDLNTAYGTYVNENRIQNSTVKLEPGDKIRFGYGGILHEFGMVQASDKNNFNYQLSRLHADSKAHYKQEQKSEIETGFIETLQKQRKRPKTGKENTSFLNLGNFMRPETAPNMQQNMSSVFMKRATEDRAKSVPINIKMMGMKKPFLNEVKSIERDVEECGSLPTSTHEGWSTDGQDMINSFEQDTNFSKVSSIDEDRDLDSSKLWYVSMLREKEERLLQMGDEISRLTMAENESRKKDEEIQKLRKKILQAETAAVNAKNNMEVTNQQHQLLLKEDEIKRLMMYKQECERKDLLLNSLKEQVERLETEKRSLERKLEYGDISRSSSPNQKISEDWRATIESAQKDAVLMEQFDVDLTKIDQSLLQNQDELDEFRKQLNLPIPERKSPQEVIMDLVTELEVKDDLINKLEGKLQEAKCEKNISEGVTRTLQRDIARGEQKICSMTSALEKAKKEAKEAIAKAQAMSNKLANLKEDIKHEEIVATMETNFLETQQKLRDVQQQLMKQHQKQEKQGRELRKAAKHTKQQTEKGRLLQEQVDELQAEVQDLSKKEQASRVMNQQTTSRLERLRGKIIQAVYTAPGSVKPEVKLADSDILTSVQKIINDRSEFHQQLCDLGQQMPPLTVTLEVPSEDGSDVELAATNNSQEKKLQKPTKKLTKK